jgi:hypothetical protein
MTDSPRDPYYPADTVVLVTIGKHVYHGAIQTIEWTAAAYTYHYTVAVSDGPFATIRVPESAIRPAPTPPQGDTNDANPE